MSARADMHRHFTEISPVYRPFAPLTGNRWNGSHENSMAWPGRRAPTSAVAQDVMSS